MGDVWNNYLEYIAIIYQLANKYDARHASARVNNEYIYARLSQIGFTILKFPIMPLSSALKLNLAMFKIVLIGRN